MLSAVSRNLDAGDDAASEILSGAGDGDMLPFDETGADDRRGNRRRWFEAVGGLGRQDKACIQCRRLDAHVCKHVDHGLLDVWISWGLIALVLIVQTPRPENGTC